MLFSSKLHNEFKWFQKLYRINRLGNLYNFQNIDTFDQKKKNNIIIKRGHWHVRSRKKVISYFFYPHFADIYTRRILISFLKIVGIESHLLEHVGKITCTTTKVPDESAKLGGFLFRKSIWICIL